MLHRDISPHVHWTEDGYVNWYLIEEGNDLTIVDAGLPRSWHSLQKALATIGRSPGDVKALVLTHAHFDHIGFAERARREWNVPIYVHERDASLCRHPLRFAHERSLLRYAWRPGCLQTLCSYTARGVMFTQAIGAARTFTDGDTLDVPGSPRVLATPGHTFGHSSLLLSDRDTLIAGDAVVASDPYTHRPGPRMVARAATANSQQNRQSLMRLADTGAKTVLTGHGPPLTDLHHVAEQASKAPIA